MGACPPPAAAAQEACRNSSLTLTRSIARPRTSSGSQTSTWVSAGSRSMSSSIPSTRAGDSASIPSTAWPCAILSSISISSGCSWDSSNARVRTASVSSSSRHGEATTSVNVDVARALIGDGEVPDLLDLVAEEVDPDGVFLRRREHVDDATTDGELAPALDEVDPDVGGADQVGREPVEVVVLADGQPDRGQVRQALDLRLQHAPYRRDDDPWCRLVGASGQAAEHGQPASHCVGTRA